MSGVFLVALLAVCFAAVQAVVNTDVSQVIDATTSIVRYSVDIKATELNGEYELIFADAWASHLAHLSVSSKGKPLSVLPPVR